MPESDWYAKARSRVWNAPAATLKNVPLWALTIATFFFVGFSPVASGTVASIAAAGLYYFFPVFQNNLLLFFLSVVLFIGGSLSGNVIEARMKEKDAGIIVADEVVGQWLALITFSYQGNAYFVILAFIFFRLFDITKLYPASLFEKRPGGWAVMLDDVVAGVYANIAAHIAMFILLRIFPL